MLLSVQATPIRPAARQVSAAAPRGKSPKRVTASALRQIPLKSPETNPSRHPGEDQRLQAMAHLGAAVILFERGGDGEMVAAVLGAVEGLLVAGVETLLGGSRRIGFAGVNARLNGGLRRRGGLVRKS